MATTITGKPYKKCILDTEIHGKVHFNIFNFHARYEECREGLEIAPDDIIQDGQYIALIDPDRGIKKPRSGSVNANMDRKEQGIEVAQNRKEDSIKISSTFRDATLITLEDMKGQDMTNELFKDRWLYWRKWLMENWDFKEPF